MKLGRAPTMQRILVKRGECYHQHLEKPTRISGARRSCESGVSSVSARLLERRRRLLHTGLVQGFGWLREGPVL